MEQTPSSRLDVSDALAYRLGVVFQITIKRNQGGPYGISQR